MLETILLYHNILKIMGTSLTALEKFFTQVSINLKSILYGNIRKGSLSISCVTSFCVFRMCSVNEPLVKFWFFIILAFLCQY